MPRILRINPSGRTYRLPAVPSHESGELAQQIADCLGGHGSLTVAFELDDDPRGRGLLFINGNVAESVELLEVDDVDGSPAFPG